MIASLKDELDQRDGAITEEKQHSCHKGAMIAKLKAQLAQRGGDLIRERCESC
jgi:hypothetical protein